MSVQGTTSLGDVAQFINGFAFQPSDWHGLGRRIIRIQNLTDPSKPYNQTTSEVDPRHLVSPGDLLVSWSASLGVFVWQGPDTALVNQHIFKVVPNEAMTDKGYLKHALEHALTQMSKHLHGSTMRHVNREEFLSTLIPLPPLSEQRRIAAILDKADGVRRKRREALRLAEELLRSAFLEMFGDPVGDPRGWEVRELSAVSEVASGVTKGRRFTGKATVWVPYMRVANVQDGHLELDDVHDIEVLESDVEKYQLQTGDVLLTEGGDPDKLGRGAVWYSPINPCIHQNHIFRVRPNQKAILPEFLSALIGSARGKRYFLKAAKQTTGIATINATQLRSFPVLLPPLALQRHYTGFVEGSRRLQAHLEDTARNQDTLFAALTQRAFRGEV